MAPLDPRFLSLQDVLDIQHATIARHGGSHGIRDIALLESAVAMPRQQFGGAWLHADVAAMAAAYLFQVVRNHGFVDGNKRVGLGACLVFLAANRISHHLDRDEVVHVVMAVASGRLDKPALTDWLRHQIVSD